MAAQSINRYHQCNYDRDDWYLHHEINVLKKFQRKLQKNKVNLRLFTTAQRTIQFAHSGRINKEGYHHILSHQVDDSPKIII